MAHNTTISIDAMGGDNAPDVIIEGVDLALKEHPNLTFLLFGDESLLLPLLEKHPRVAAASQVFHTDEAVTMEDKPSKILRKGRNTSMWLAIKAVKEDKAHVVVSAGNTGALMGVSAFQLRTMEGIDRPAIVGLWPTMKGHSVVLDLGANVEATVKHLTDFAIMGSAYAQVALQKKNPVVGLLNIGEEELKGHEEVREAAAVLKDPELGLNFCGFVEGTDISKGDVDVIVTDGFSGNIALKTAEGTAKLLAHFMREAFNQSWMTKLGAVIAQKAFSRLKETMDPRQGNGGMFLGLNGLVVKSHGGTDAMGFANAIENAAELSTSQFEKRIVDTLSHVDLERLKSNGSSDENGSSSESTQEVAVQ